VCVPERSTQTPIFHIGSVSDVTKNELWLKSGAEMCGAG